MVIYRELITPDGTKLVSHHRHDFVVYTDKNGKVYMLDGGYNSGYYRTSCNGDENIVEITSDAPFTTKREYFERYNVHSKSYVKLKDIPDDWLQNIIDYLNNRNPGGIGYQLYLEEKLYRIENEIYI
jgi:hypothetical protein